MGGGPIFLLHMFLIKIEIKTWSWNVLERLQSKHDLLHRTTMGKRHLLHGVTQRGGVSPYFWCLRATQCGSVWAIHHPQ